MSQALFRAVNSGDISKSKAALAEGADINCIHKPTGRTPLFSAVMGGDLPLAEFLVNEGANINHCDTAMNYTPLMWACYYGNCDMVDLLIKSGVDVNFRSKSYGWTALLVATEKSLIVVQKLVEAGADVTATKTNGESIFDRAKKGNQTEIIQWLQNAGVKPPPKLAEPAVLKWPSIKKDLSNVDFTSPESVVYGLIIAMNRYELDAAKKPESDTNAMQAEVFSQFCTPKERTYGRNGSFQMPPEYDPKAEDLLESKITRSNRCEVMTRNSKRKIEYIYILAKKGGRWLVDSKKYHLIGGEWDSWSI